MQSERPPPRPRGDKRARTRAAILEAARKLVEEKGYGQTSIQEIARRAGVSNGALYGNFASRDDLFAALGPTYWPRVTARVEPGAGVPEILRAIAEALIAALPARARAGEARLQGIAYAIGNEGLRARAEQAAEAAYAAAADWWRRMVPDESRLPMPPETLVRVIAALTEGLTYQRLVTPGLISDEVIHAAFAALAPTRPTSGPA